MVPVSWEAMRDPETGRVEKRKVAKVAVAAAAK
jgi:exosome complex RNA-binding protein Csl4